MIHSAHCRALFATALLAVMSVAIAAPTALPQPRLDAAQFEGMGQTVPPVIGMSASGRFYVAGAFTAVDGKPRPGIARFNADGTLDAWTPTNTAGLDAHFALEDATGNVAVAYGEVGTTGRLVYFPAATQAGILLDTEPAAGGRQFNRLAFDASGSLYTAISRRCSQGIGSQGAEVRKYIGGTTRDNGFSLTPANPSFIYNGQPMQGLSCVSALTVHEGQVYVGGYSDPNLTRASAATGAIDPIWRPAYQGKVHSILPGGPGTIYVTGNPDNSAPQALSRVSTSGAGAIDASWQPRVQPTDSWAPMVIDPVGGHLYLGGSASLEGITGLVAVSLATGEVVSTWAPNPASPQFPWNAGVGALAVVGDKILVGGGFLSGPNSGASLAAFPLATAPVTWAVARISPRELDFGLTFKEGQVRTRTATLTNIGAGMLTVGQPYIPNRPDLSISQNTCTAPLGPGASCSVAVTLTLPVGTHTVGTGWFPGALFIPHDGAGVGSAAIFANNNGEHELVISSPILRPDNMALFPRAVPGTSRTGDFTITNVSNRAIEIEDVRPIAAFVPPGTFTSTHNCPASLPAAGTCAVRVTFTPPSEGVIAYGLLRIASEGSAREPFLDARGSMLAEDEDKDGLANGAEVAMGRDPYVKDNDIFASAQLFAMQQYRDFLGRAPDDSGTAFWAARLADGSVTRAAMVSQFLASPEFGEQVAPITRLYLAYFLRIPDYTGLDFWIGQHLAGASFDSISGQFASSPEFAARYGALDNGQFVDRVYRNVLGRAPDAAGLAYWTGQLATLTRGQMMLAFSESAEYRALTTSEVFVTMVYAGMLRRTPEPAGFAYWVDSLDAGTSAASLIQAMLDSPEYRSRFLGN